MRLLVFSILVIPLSCNTSSNTQTSVKSGLEFVLDSLISKHYEGKYSIDKVFTVEIDESFLKQDLEEMSFLDTMNFNIQNIIEQNNKLTGLPITDYIDDHYYDKIASGNDVFNSELHFNLGVPLFNESRTLFIQYQLIENYSTPENESWNHQYIICKLSQQRWELQGIVKIKRNELVHTID